jgi:hypothetical protein
VNWNLGASFLPDVFWKGREGGKLNCLFPLPSFIRWSTSWALPSMSAAKKGGGYYNTNVVCMSYVLKIRAPVIVMNRLIPCAARTSVC